MGLTSEGKRRIRRMICATRNARVLDAKKIAIVVHTRWHDDSLLWEHPYGGAAAPILTDVLLAAGYTVHCIGTQDAPATAEAVRGSISAITATLPHKKQVFARKKITLTVLLIGTAVEDHNGTLYMVPQVLPVRGHCSAVPQGSGGGGPDDGRGQRRAVPPPAEGIGPWSVPSGGAPPSPSPPPPPKGTHGHKHEHTPQIQRGCIVFMHFAVGAGTSSGAWGIACSPAP